MLKRDAAMIERDQRIVALRASGMTLQAIADQFGLTRERVRQIVAGKRYRRVRGRTGAA